MKNYKSLIYSAALVFAALLLSFSLSARPWQDANLRDIRPAGPWNFAVAADAQAVPAGQHLRFTVFPVLQDPVAEE